jgi:hypothetical protein
MTMHKNARLARAFGQFLFAAAFALAIAPQQAWACACGCGVFEVGAGSMRPSGKGGTVSIEDDFMNQNRNWSGSSRASADDNEDKQIRSNFTTVGVQYMFNRAWGVMGEAPVTERKFRTDDGMGGIDAFKHAALGDIRLMGVYSGFSPDMSTGVTFGVKLPTGDWKDANFDRDTAIGSGSTDLLLGAYHQGSLCKSGKIAYFVQGLWTRPVADQGGYRPGQELDGAFGIYFNGASIGGGKVRISPILQLIASQRARDTGPQADPADSGYTRVMLSPGLEFDTDNWKLYGDVEFPIYQHVNGDQLVPPELFRIVLTRNF